MSMTDAEFYKEFKSSIPKGVYYEVKKDRWRVRLYKEGAVIYLGYFKSYEEAIDAWIIAKDIQEKATPQKTDSIELNTDSTNGLITSLTSL